MEILPAASAPSEHTILMPSASSYESGLRELYSKCSSEKNQVHPHLTLPNGHRVYRPLTAKETARAQMEQFYTLHNADGSEKTLEQRTEFMSPFIDTCSGIAYPPTKNEVEKFMLIPLSPDLINLGHYRVLDCPPTIKYDRLKGGTELFRDKAKYNQPLLSHEIDVHPGWLTLFEGDETFLREYRQGVFEALALKHPDCIPQTAMTFRLREPWILFSERIGSFDSVSIGSVFFGNEATSGYSQNRYSPGAQFLRKTKPNCMDVACSDIK